MSRLFKLISYVSAFVLCISCLQEERSPEDILIPSPAQVDCSASSFSLTSKVPNGSEKLVDECGFLVGTAKDMADAVTVEGTMTANSFAAELPMRKYGTTYYICSYVTNGHGSEIRSDVSSFALESLDKYVKFGAVTVSSYDMASKTTELSLAADIWAGVEVSEAGLCYGESEVLSLEGDYAAGSLANDGAIYITINGFIDGDKYYLRPYLRDGEYLAYGDVVEFSIPAVPVVKTYDAAEVTSEGAVLSGEVVKGADISERGFMLAEGESSAADMKQKKVVEGTIGEYTLALDGLLPNQKYTYCAYTVNPTGTYYGEVKVFTTTASKPSVSSPVASSITSTSATLSAAVRSHGGETVSEVGFYYGTDPSLDTETSSKVSSLYSQDAFFIEVSDLTVNTKYYVKSYAKNSVGVTFSAAESFMTSVSSPSVKTVGSSEVTSTSVTLSGLVVSDNGAAITERGFVWLQGSGIPTTESYRLKVDGNTGEFTGTVTGLDPGEKYSFRAYAINPKGTSYGEIMNFTTVAGLPVLSATRITDVKTTSAVFASTVTSHGGATVSEVGFYYSTDENVDVATAVKVSETYSTDSFTLQINDLEVGTEYYVKSYAKNSAGEDYGAVAYFKTVGTAPSVITSGASKLTATSAELSGEVADDNGETITDRGFVWMTGTGTPSTSSGNRIQVIGTTGEFSATLEDLEPNQTYSFRAYAVNSKGTSYGETLTFRTEVALPVVEFTSCSDVTSSSAVVFGKVTDHGGETVSETGFLYGTTPVLDPSAASRVKSAYSGDSFSFTLSGLTRAQNYYVQPFATNSKGTSYGDVTMFTTLPSLPIVTTNDVTAITDNSAMSGGVVADDGGGEILSKGVVWSRSQNPTVENSFKTDEGSGTGSFTSYLTALTPGRTYYVRAYAANAVGTAYGVQQEFKTTGEAPFETMDPANCFIVSDSGTYAFEPVKGNSSESVGTVAATEVLWESFGTSETPSVGSLIAAVSIESGYIVFEVPSPFKDGNAVIAAKDASGTILWSWHIWLTDEPEGQVYYNNAGTMMDRNLGATSATPGDVGALGLLYQWGRKDPFLGSSSISEEISAKSTLTWPSKVSSNSTNGTIKYATEHPTTFITDNSNNYDWYYTGSSSIDDTRWQSDKTIYDPCPVGWRVPDGGDNGVWSNALASSSLYYGTYDKTNEGMNFSGKFGSASTIWYPASGSRNYDVGALSLVGYYGYYWSVTLFGYNAYSLYFDNNGYVYPTYYYNRALGFSVRCFKEGSGIDMPEAEVLTYSLDSVTESSAILYGEVVSDGGLQIIERGFVWEEGEGTPMISSNKLTVNGTVGEFSAELNGLKSDQLYSYSAYAINAGGVISYGGIVVFRTQAYDTGFTAPDWEEDPDFD